MQLANTSRGAGLPSGRRTTLRIRRRQLQSPAVRVCCSAAVDVSATAVDAPGGGNAAPCKINSVLFLIAPRTSGLAQFPTHYTSIRAAAACDAMLTVLLPAFFAHNNPV